MRLSRLSLVFLLVLMAATTGSASDLGTLQASFMARYDEANATRDEQLGTLRDSYAGALARHLDKVRSSGDLTRAVPVRDEIEAVKSGAEPLPTLPANTDRELAEMRAKYLDARGRVRRAHADTLVDLSTKMSGALEAEERALTRAGKLDDALSARRMRETLEKDPGIVAARSLASGGGRMAPATPAEWRLLVDEKMKVVKRGEQQVGKLSDVAGEGRGFWARMLPGGERDPEKVLVTPTPARISFRPETPVREIRGEVALAFAGGRATVVVKAGGKTVFEKELGEGTRSERIDLEFEPTDEIDLEVEGGGRRAVWIYWDEVEIR